MPDPIWASNMFKVEVQRGNATANEEQMPVEPIRNIFKTYPRIELISGGQKPISNLEPTVTT